jgi:hypothetical protein
MIQLRLVEQTELGRSSPHNAVLKDAAALTRRLEEQRDWDGAHTVRALGALVAIAQGEKAMLASENIRLSAIAHDLDLCAGAMRAARERLEASGVPPATFFDDAVANAVVQRNRIALAVIAAVRQLYGSSGSMAADVIIGDIPEELTKALIDNGCTALMAEEGMQAAKEGASV